MNLSGKRIVFVIAPKQFRDEELLEPKAILSASGANVKIACCELSEAQGMLGAKVKPDVLIANVKPQDCDAVVVVGGMGSPTYLWQDAHLQKLLQDVSKAGRVVAGICLSGAALALAGVLAGKEATVWACPESLEALKTGGAIYTNKHVVRDGLIVTADGPEAATEFANTIVETMLAVPANAVPQKS